MVWDSELGNSPKRVSEILARIYQTEFGGKNRGRFRTSRNNFRKIANVPLLTDEYIGEVSLWLRKKDLILIDLDNAFCVFPLSSTASFRRVPETVIAPYVERNEGGFAEPAARQCRAGLEKAWQALSELEPGITHFIIHPSRDTAELRAITPDWPSRVADYETFLLEEMREAIQELGLHVIGYRPIKELMPA